MFPLLVVSTSVAGAYGLRSEMTFPEASSVGEVLKMGLPERGLDTFLDTAAASKWLGSDATTQEFLVKDKRVQMWEVMYAVYRPIGRKGARRGIYQTVRDMWQGDMSEEVVKYMRQEDEKCFWSMKIHTAAVLHAHKTKNESTYKFSQRFQGCHGHNFGEVNAKYANEPLHVLYQFTGTQTLREVLAAIRQTATLMEAYTFATMLTMWKQIVEALEQLRTMRRGRLAYIHHNLSPDNINVRSYKEDKTKYTLYVTNLGSMLSTEKTPYNSGITDCDSDFAPAEWRGRVRGSLIGRSRRTLRRRPSAVRMSAVGATKVGSSKGSPSASPASSTVASPERKEATDKAKSLLMNFDPLFPESFDLYSAGCLLVYLATGDSIWGATKTAAEKIFDDFDASEVLQKGEKHEWIEITVKHKRFWQVLSEDDKYADFSEILLKFAWDDDIQMWWSDVAELFNTKPATRPASNEILQHPIMMDVETPDDEEYDTEIRWYID